MFDGVCVWCCPPLGGGAGPAAGPGLRAGAGAGGGEDAQHRAPGGLGAEPTGQEHAAGARLRQGVGGVRPTPGPQGRALRTASGLRPTLTSPVQSALIKVNNVL